jgi:cytochrome P450
MDLTVNEKGQREVRGHHAVREAGPSPDGGPKDYVHLHFLSANRDPSVWTDPDRLGHPPGTPPAPGVGSGRHSCIGMNITEYASKAFLRAILEPLAQLALRHRSSDPVAEG